MVIESPDFVEEPVLFGRDRSLVGSLCKPTDMSEGPRPFVVFLSSGIIHRAGPNRNYVRVARALARVGFPSLRFDLSGIGDSLLPKNVPGMSIQERTESDIDDAFDFLRARQAAKAFVLIGLCSGADNALRTMGRDERVVGSILLDLNVDRTLGFYIRHYVRRVARLDSWLNVLTGRHPGYRTLGQRLWERDKAASKAQVLSPAPSLSFDAVIPHDLMREHLEKVVARSGKLLCVFTAGLEGQYNYREQFLRLFPGLNFQGCLRLEYFADTDHTFSRVAPQGRLTRTIVEWLEESEFCLSADPSAEDVIKPVTEAG